MPRIVKAIGKWLLAFLVATIICTTIWQFTAADLYDCTDDGFPLGYLDPGDWVHGSEHHPIKTVPKVIHGRSMSEPDTIKEGWSIPRLWRLWWSFFVESLVLTVIFVWVPRRFTRTARRIP